MILGFLEDPNRSAADAYGPTQHQAIIDHPNIANPVTFTTAIPNSGMATRTCTDVPAAQVYSPPPTRAGCKLHPAGLRGQHLRQGRRVRQPALLTTSGSSTGSDGLRSGALNAQQFADLNGKIGGFDEAGNVEPRARGAADPAALAGSTAAAPSTRRQQPQRRCHHRPAGAGQRAPSTTSTAPTPCATACCATSGRPPTRCLWQGQVDLFGDTNYADQSVIAANGWVAAYEADTRNIPLSQKIIEDKPLSLTTAAPTARHRCAARDLRSDGHPLRHPPFRRR